MYRRTTLLLVAGAALLCARPARPDAIVVTQAMKATTILEVRVEPDRIRVDLEIGVADLQAFRNILPDALYERLGHEPRPLLKRFEPFFTEDWVLRADGGEPLVPRIEEIRPEKRITRDEVTGEPLPVQPEDAETVLQVVLVYALEGRPATMTLKPPTEDDTGIASASIGFVTYHRGLPVNDFRYLSREETLDLDWTDPWFSQFRNRNLWRRYAAPIQAFLYVDHFEVRKEIIVRPMDLQHWIDLGLEGRDVIPVAEQEALKGKVAEFLAARSPVTVDGRAAEGTLDRIHFVRRTLRRTGVIDPPEDMPLISATLGVIFVYPVAALPQEATMTWELFSPRVPQVPTVATDEAGGLPSYVTPEDPVLTWKNFLKNPSDPSLAEIALPRDMRLRVSLASAACALVALVLLLRKKRLAAGILVVLGAALWPLLRVPVTPASAPPQEEAREVVGGILKNVYRAFDYRTEVAIYDALFRSVTGDLLSRIYLETKRSLVLESQGGATVKVKGVEMLEARAEALEDGPGFLARCEWIVDGSVGHWGHIHRRRNRYDAELTIRTIDGVWKITDIDVLSEQRL